MSYLTVRLLNGEFQAYIDEAPLMGVYTSPEVALIKAEEFLKEFGISYEIKEG